MPPHFNGKIDLDMFPDLAEDNHYIDQPYGPEDGYHLSKDLADQALKMIRDSNGASGEGSPNGSVDENKFLNVPGDDAPLVQALSERGVLSRPAVWTDDSVDWSAYGRA